MNTTMRTSSIGPAFSPQTTSAKPPRARHSMMRRPYAFLVGIGRMLAMLVWMLVSLAVGIAIAGALLFLLPWLLMLPMILTGGIVDLLDVAARWLTT